jgi:hypothetical protein
MIGSATAALILAAVVADHDVSHPQRPQTVSAPEQLDPVRAATTINRSIPTPDRANRRTTAGTAPLEQPPDERGLHLVNSPVTRHPQSPGRTLLRRS